MHKLLIIPYLLVGGFSFYLFVISFFFYIFSGGKGIEGLGGSPVKGFIGLIIYGGIVILCGATVIGILREKRWGYIVGLAANFTWIGLFVLFFPDSSWIILWITAIIPILTTPIFIFRLLKSRT